MSRITLSVSILLVAGYLFSLAGESNPRRAGSVSDRSETVEQASGPKKLYFGIKACRECHSKKEADPDLVCRCDEMFVWDKLDKHKDANEVLKGDRAKQMAKLLKAAKLVDEKVNIWEEPSCISCHGVLVEDKKYQHSSFALSDGVSCVACHGAYKDWVDTHGSALERDEWRKASRADKEKKYGMRDLWDPAKRAALCATCHIGNIAEKKVVTHDMYAAGHPPLPGIEVALFSEAMPRHWQYLHEKKPNIQKLLDFDGGNSSLERTELVVLAGLVSLRETLNLVAGQADLGAAPKAADQAWPELAHFDCYACHHDLKSKSWRQERGYAGKPGRPNMRAWPLTLVQLALAHLSDKKGEGEFHTSLKKLISAYDAQPFGEPAEVAKAARGLAKWSDDAIAEVKKKRIDKPAVRSLLLALGNIAKDKLLDYDSARQVAWAFQIMHAELDPALAKDEQITSGLKKLDEILKLSLPQGQEPIENHMKESLLRIAGYEPAPFQEVMARLVARVKELTK